MVIIPVSADLNLGFKVSNDFVYAPGPENPDDSLINTDEYVMNNDTNTRISIMEYDDAMWELTTTPSNEAGQLYNAWSFDGNKNIHIYSHPDKDYLCYSGAAEVIEYNGQMYIVEIQFDQKTIDTVDQEKNAASYLEEFNKLNEVKAIEM